MATRKRATWSGSARGRTGEVVSQSQAGRGRSEQTETEKAVRGRTRLDAEKHWTLRETSKFHFSVRQTEARGRERQ